MISPIPAGTTAYLMPAVNTPTSFYGRVGRAGKYRCLNFLLDRTIHPAEVVIDFEIVGEDNRDICGIGHAISQADDTHHVTLNLPYPIDLDNGTRLKIQVQHGNAAFVGVPFQIIGDMVEVSP